MVHYIEKCTESEHVSQILHKYVVLLLICYLYLRMCELKSRDLVSPPTSLQKILTCFYSKNNKPQGWNLPPKM